MADEKERMRNIQNLLSSTGILQESYRQAKKKFAGKLAPDFNLFGFFKINENTLSKCLAFLLNPRETHAQGDLFLNRFYELVDFKHFSDDEKDPLVHTEYVIDSNRRIDIVIQSEDGFIGIENKPWASDQKDQLSDYARWLEIQAWKKKRQARLIFLCNWDISECSLKPKTSGDIRCSVKQVTFFELEKWLADCAVYIKAPAVLFFTDALIKFIRTDINEEVDVELQKELLDDFISTPEKFESAILIEKNIQQAKARLWDNLINYINFKINKFGMVAKSNEKLQKGSSMASFDILFPECDKYALRWQFDSANYRDLCCGVMCIVEPKKIWVKRDFPLIYSKLNKLFPLIEGHDNDYWPWVFLADEGMNIPRDWEGDSEVWKLLFDYGKDSFAQKIINMALIIHRRMDFSLLQ